MYIPIHSFHHSGLFTHMFWGCFIVRVMKRFCIFVSICFDLGVGGSVSSFFSVYKLNSLMILTVCSDFFFKL